jgi:hypothetical protein
MMNTFIEYFLKFPDNENGMKNGKNYKKILKNNECLPMKESTFKILRCPIVLNFRYETLSAIY